MLQEKSESNQWKRDWNELLEYWWPMDTYLPETSRQSVDICQMEVKFRNGLMEKFWWKNYQ